jgi:hypothetical protein
MHLVLLLLLLPSRKELLQLPMLLRECHEREYCFCIHVLLV